MHNALAQKLLVVIFFHFRICFLFFMLPLFQAMRILEKASPSSFFFLLFHYYTTCFCVSIVLSFLFISILDFVIEVHIRFSKIYNTDTHTNTIELFIFGWRYIFIVRDLIFSSWKASKEKGKQEFRFLSIFRYHQCTNDLTTIRIEVSIFTYLNSVPIFIRYNLDQFLASEKFFFFWKSFIHEI